MIESSIIVNEHNTSFELLVSVLALLFLLMLTLLLLSRESCASVRILSRHYLFICKVFYRISKYPVFFLCTSYFFWKHKQPYSNACCWFILIGFFFFSFRLFFTRCFDVGRLHTALHDVWRPPHLKWWLHYFHIYINLFWN